jgi:hypothetical protein
MGHDEAADTLESILDEEKATDEKLTTLAEASINDEAASGAHGEDDADDEDDGAAVATPAAKRPTSPKVTAMKKR